MFKTIQVGQRSIGANSPCFIIAEAGVNHNGDVNLALDLISVAKKAGADAVKFQTFRAERLATAHATKANYQLRHTAQDESQLEMLKKLELPDSAYARIVERCGREGIIFLSSPFDEEAADLLERYNVPAFKIPSGEIINLGYLAHIARKGRPMIVSTGMATMTEVAVAIDTIRENGNPQICLLQCVSDYPARPDEQNLLVMRTFESAFGVPAGYSDHTEGYAVTAAAVALGAHVVEKHFTLDRSLPGPDHQASLDPDSLAEMVQAIRSVEAALGDGVKQPRGNELETRIHARKSLVAACEISAGTILTAKDVISRRPGTGLSPALVNTIIGRRTRRLISAEALLTLDDIE